MNLLEWDPIEITMAFYIFQGVIITILNIPLLTLLTLRKKNRDRKEFVLIAIVSTVDFFYVIVNCINSYDRIIKPYENIPRVECVQQPLFFISLVASQLVAGMPLMIAIDRFIASFFGVWYFKQTVFYSIFICIIPILFGFAVTSFNSYLIASNPDQNGYVMSHCFTSSLPAPVFKLTFHFIKWMFIILAGLIYGMIAIVLKTSAKYKHRGYNKKISTANRVMGLTTMNSVLFHLIPDVLLVFPPKVENTIALQCVLYSLILDKIIFNYVLYMIFHKELRQMYFSMFFRKMKSHQNSSELGGNRAGGRMFAAR